MDSHNYVAKKLGKKQGKRPLERLLKENKHPRRAIENRESPPKFYEKNLYPGELDDGNEGAKIVGKGPSEAEKMQERASSGATPWQSSKVVEKIGKEVLKKGERNEEPKKGERKEEPKNAAKIGEKAAGNVDATSKENEKPAALKWVRGPFPFDIGYTSLVQVSMCRLCIWRTKNKGCIRFVNGDCAMNWMLCKRCLGNNALMYPSA